MDGNILTAFLLTLLAGLATGIGSLIVFFWRNPSLKLLSFGLGFSGGVMVFISLAELYVEAGHTIGEVLGEKTGQWIAFACFFAGILVSAIIDKLVPEPKNPHEAVSLADIERTKTCQESLAPRPNGNQSSRSLARLGLLTTLVIAIHNFPEGMATFVSTMADTSLGLSVAVAVAIHNIPEGISVAVLVYAATQNRGKAFAHSFASGLAEPMGALAVYLLLMPFINGALVGGMLAVVAGIMVFISFDELLPTAREYNEGHIEIAGVVLGMAVMAVSLLLV